MNIQRIATRRLEEEIANAGVPLRGDQVPPLEEDVNDDQGPVDPPLTNGATRFDFFQMDIAISTLA